MKKFFGIVMAFLLCAGCAQPPEHVQDTTLKLLWAQWAPSDYLQQLSGDFTRKTGIKVVVEQVPWEEFYSTFFDHTHDYDMVGGDSQWLGRGAVDGIYVNLSKWLVDHDVDQTMTEASITGYCEYPKGSRHYWAVPLMGDAMGFAYRRDLFEDLHEQEAFKARYGYALDVPKTWDELRDIAEFFYRPQDDLYGVNVWASQEYDATTMGVQTLVWAWGAGLGDPKTYRVEGVLDTFESAEALRMYKALHSFGAPEWKNAYLGINKAFMNGKAAMVMSYFAFFPDLLDPEKNPYAAVTGFFANPSGPKGRFSSLGGQGLSVVSFSRKKEQCLKFLRWFIQEDVQKKWAMLGGYSCNKAVLNSEDFLKATPYNPAMRESMLMLRDFWVVPEYLDLLAVSQNYWTRYLFEDSMTAEQAMEAVADSWENIFELAGYYKE